MFLRLNQSVRLMICFLAGLCATIMLSGTWFTKPAAAVGSNIRTAPHGYYYQAPVPVNSINAAFAASHQAPNYYN
jgi:hypothetical protein